MAENKTARTSADGPEYERGFVDGMQHQMQLHVNRVIKTWSERCEEHPDHQERIISERMIQERMQEEIDELRQALETEREWVGLTADEIWQCNKASGSAVEFHICYEHQNVLDFAESLEAKLREKNHG